MKIRYPIRLKLFLLLAGLTIAVLSSVLIAVNILSTRAIREDVISDFSSLQRVFKLQQDSRYQRLIESATLLAENPAFKANVELMDESSVYFSVLEFSHFTVSDVLIVTDAIGNVIAWYGRPDLHGTNLAANAIVADAINGYYPEFDPDWPTIWAFDGRLNQIVAIPIIKANDIVVGTLILGSLFTEYEAEELQLNPNLDISFFLGNELIASSNKELESDDFWEFLLENPGLIDSVTTQLSLSETFQTNIAGTEVLLSVSPLGIGEDGYFIATVPVVVEFDELIRIQDNIIIIAVLSIILIILISIVLGRLFSEPIKNLSSAMEQVSGGYFEVRVDSKLKDEIGLMTRNFNQMVGGLKERFALSNYVGTHTLKMIKETSQGKMELGGTREDLAILFTDIRGSTAKIENSTPEQFIENLNNTLTAQAKAVDDFHGSIDKFVGDSIIALFSGKDALERAIKAAISMQIDFYGDKHIPTFFAGLGIGINYGSMVLGNMGAQNRMDYTVIGPEVNLCARLCSATESGQILVPKQKVNEHHLSFKFRFNEVEPKSLKGFSMPIQTLEVIYE